MLEPQTDIAIFKLFLWRCVECKRMATELNHIIPKGRKEADVEHWTNKVPMCHDCHAIYHRGGVTEEKIKLLQQKRVEYLVSIGKADYATEKEQTNKVS